MNQFGEVQPIGGVNEKIEGFFAACQLKGLTGEQGVVIPVQNVRHLMLRSDVLAAVKAGQFRIYAVSRVEEAVELLLGRAAGSLSSEGEYPEGSVFAAVADRFEVWHDAEKMKRMLQSRKTDFAVTKKGGNDWAHPAKTCPDA